mmetsp:Transcript_106614/g.211759  ORF Transcript_106614/g.211759 Transcript_106614/m.211759 type:complete len:191 (+) Transcript_106614:28-600(+)
MGSRSSHLALAALATSLNQHALGTLCVSQTPGLERLVLEVRRRHLQDMDAQTLASEEELNSIRPLSPEVRDDSICSSADGPYCSLAGLMVPPVVADGVRFRGSDFSLMVETNKPAPVAAEKSTSTEHGSAHEAAQSPVASQAATTVHGKSVSCGGHWAEDCAQCPQGNGHLWCNGDCMWVEEQCVLKPKP